MNLNLQLPIAAAVCSVALVIACLFYLKSSTPCWAMAAGLLALAAESVFTALGTSHSAPIDRLVRWQGQRLVAASFQPGLWLLFSLVYARGNADEFLRRWRSVLGAAFFGPVALAVVFYRNLIVGWGRGSVGNGLVYALGPAGLALEAMLLIGSVLVVMNLERTWRASIGTMRWRIKFILLGVGLLFAVKGFTATQALLFRVAEPAFQQLNCGAIVVAGLMIVRSLRRAGRAELDVYPSKSVIQGSVTVLLAGTYLLIVGACARLLARIAGGNLFALEAMLVLVSLTVLVVLFQSDRLRLRLGRFVSRHFHRPLYDYRTVWLRFTEGTASQVDQTAFCRSLVRLVADVYHCLSVSIWIVDERHEHLTLAASTVSSEGQSGVIREEEVAALIAYFGTHPEPLPFSQASSGLAQALERLHPSKFRRQENRVCLPLIGRGRVIALLVAGDRVEGEVFSNEDLDMLRCVGDHGSATLLNIWLAQRLVQATELQAFQTMAAFFVHDLKNAASTLSIMLKNLPVHFEDPLFREDALRGVTKSVAHINHLIGRLSMLRSELKLHPEDADLNDIVEEALAGLDGGGELSIVKLLQPLPRIPLDRREIAKVVTNLVMNAHEATTPAGEIQISTRAEGSWGVLSVSDRGCGMTPDFIAHSLFRPFQTTKKSGLGIGMFQSRMIVEMHGGRVVVESQPGAGSKFEVYLPLRAPTS